MNFKVGDVITINFRGVTITGPVVWNGFYYLGDYTCSFANADGVPFAGVDIIDVSTPPTPPEPYGLGAVVRDAVGDVLIRVISGVDNREKSWYLASDKVLYGWNSLEQPVEILHEGLT